MLTDELWDAMEPLVRAAKTHKGGQPPVLPERMFFEAVLGFNPLPPSSTGETRPFPRLAEGGDVSIRSRLQAREKRADRGRHV